MSAYTPLNKQMNPNPNERTQFVSSYQITFSSTCHAVHWTIWFIVVCRGGLRRVVFWASHVANWRNQNREEVTWSCQLKYHHDLCPRSVFDTRFPFDFALNQGSVGAQKKVQISISGERKRLSLLIALVWRRNIVMSVKCDAFHDFFAPPVPI